MMTVAEAISGRQSIRAYLDRPVDRETIERIVRTAGRAPSGNNAQPWKLHVLQGAALERLTRDLTQRHASGDMGEREYNYYPVRWREPYLGRRRATGWGLYGLLGITRENKEGMARQHRQNFSFFGAPVGLIFTIDRDLEVGSWLDLGTFVQSVMIAARGEGLETCPQAAFCSYHQAIREHLGIPQDEIVATGMAMGYADPGALINTFRTDRIDLDDFASWHEA